MGNRLKDKVALVTGAGSIGPGWGNGKAAAVLYAREGAQILAVDLNMDAAEETRSIIAAEGGDCTPLQADVTNAAQVAAMLASCLRAYGRIDILHNNVGIPHVGGPEETAEEDWDMLFAVNAKSMYLTCQACLPQMVAQGSGAIVNISSVASLRYVGFPSAAYSAAKAAVNQLTQNIAVQYAGQGIRANCVLPGLMRTPQIERYITEGYGGDAEQMIRERDALVPMGHMGDAWDVAHAALFVASDEAKYITGIQLVVDGGISCKMG
ncbi:MAG TPA: SDR family oxidoreductase [Candidatus Latescibacteria bacterium]|nr:SDR family oxidoreductase [Candidatus Handelsmanbacteria bacterium]HIL11473.1 SDR family oxidoreductase [Candidatus Latescibacterota bacterium]